MPTVHFQRIWPKSQLLGPNDGFKLQSSLLLHSEENWDEGTVKKRKEITYIKQQQRKKQ